jgi:hypothetical protein
MVSWAFLATSMAFLNPMNLQLVMVTCSTGIDANCQQACSRTRGVCPQLQPGRQWCLLQILGRRTTTRCWYQETYLCSFHSSAGRQLFQCW